MFISPSDTNYVFVIKFFVKMPRNTPVGSHVSVTPKPPVVPRLGNGLTQSQMDDYSSLISQYKGTGFDKLLEANPYLSANREKSGWERFLSSLGFRTNYDVDLDQNAQAVREYAAQAVQNAREEKYNSEVEQVKRAGQAGLNADLAGVNNAQATEFAQEQNSPQFAGSDEAQLGQVASLCMDVLSASMGFSKDLQSFRILRNQVESGEIDNASSMLELAIKGVGLSPVLDEEGDVSQYSQLRDIEERLSPLFRSRRTKSRFKDAFQASAVSLRHHLDSYKVAGDFEQARKDFLSRRASKYYDPVDETMQDFLSPLIRLSEQLNEKRMSKDSKQADYDEQRVGVLDPELSALSENVQNSAEVQSAEMDKNINSVLAEIIRNLASSAKKGNTLSQISLLLFSVLRSRVGI